jgi:hypothetical protein
MWSVINNFKLKILIIGFLSMFVIGCNTKAPCKSTYFGGKIINPKSDYVVLYKNIMPLDTFFLDKNNSFLGEILSLHEGLYNFKHGNEEQYIYLNPKDSLLIRLNTWKFDETLVFSGIGAERNNLLIDSFLESEKDKKVFNKYYDLSPSEFNSKIIQAEKVKLNRYDDYVSKHPEESDKFKNIFKIALTYPLYSKIENYPIAHSVEAKNSENLDISNYFYKHREHISLDNDSLMHFYAYRNYVENHMYNIVNSLGYDINSNEFTVKLLNTISTELNDVNSKNSMLRKTFIRHFYWNSSNIIHKNTVDTFLKSNTNPTDKNLVTNLTIDVQKIKEGSLLEDFKITDYNKTQRSVNKLIKNENSVLYFWNPKYIDKNYLAKKIQYFSAKYPNVKFIGVKIKGDYKDRIYKLDIKSQYYLETTSKANTFLTSQIPRTILINNKGIVVNSFASLSSRKFYKQIDDLAKN